MTPDVVLGGLLALAFLAILIFTIVTRDGRSAPRPPTPIEAALGQATPGAHALVLTYPGRRKIVAIDLVRQLTGRSLKDAKDLVDSAPAVLRDGLDEATARTLAELLCDEGLVVEVRGAPSAEPTLAVRSRAGGRRCPFCQADVPADEPQVACADCLSRHHRECWDEHAQCASCGGTGRFAELEQTEGRERAEPERRKGS